MLLLVCLQLIGALPSNAEDTLSLQWPVKNHVLTKPFHPDSVHNGIDVSSSDTGTVLVFAAQSGDIIAAGWDDVGCGGTKVEWEQDSTPSQNCGGYRIKIKHEVSSGVYMYTLYAHLEEGSYRTSGHVAQGEEIGIMACTGTCTGKHVHFSLMTGPLLSSAIDPAGYMSGAEPSGQSANALPRLDSDVVVTPAPLVGPGSFNFTFWLKNTGTTEFSIGDALISGTSANSNTWNAGWSGTLTIPPGERRNIQLSGMAYDNDFGTWIIRKEVVVRKQGTTDWYPILLGDFAFPSSFMHQDPTIPPVMDSDVSVYPTQAWSGGSYSFKFFLRNPDSHTFDAEEIYIEGHSASGGLWKMNAQPQVIPAGQRREFIATLQLPANDPGTWPVTKLIQIKKRGGGWYTINQGSFGFPAEFYVRPMDTTVPVISLTAPGNNYQYTYEILTTATASDPESGIQGVEFHFKIDGTWRLMYTDTNPADGFSYHFPGNSYGPQSDLQIVAWAINNAGRRTQSGAFTGITNIDTTPPYNVSVSGVNNGQTFAGDWINVQGAATDNVGVSYMTFHLGYPGGRIDVTDNTPNDGWSARFNIRDLPNMTGMYIDAHASDGHNAPTASGAITNLATARTCPCFVNLRSGQGFDTQVDAVVNIPSNVNWLNLYLTPQGQGFRGVGATRGSDGLWRASWNVSDLPEGQVLMIDGWIGYPSGNVQTPVLTGMVIDRSNPTMHLTGPGESATFNSTLTVTAAPQDAVSGIDRVTFYLAWPGNSIALTDWDGSDGWAQTFDTSVLAPGSYRIDAWTYDRAGRGGHAPEVWWLTKN